MGTPRNYDDLRLLVRNFPFDFTEQEITKFLSMFDPTSTQVQIESRTAVVKFPNADHAKDVLKVLHQAPLNGCLLFVEYPRKNINHLYLTEKSEHQRINGCDHCKSNNELPATVSETMKRIYATSDQLDFSQPVPPCLKYEYPLINRVVIDSISIALESSPRFYTQVLHLMNRMNMEPPFVPGTDGLLYAKIPKEEDSLQRTHVSTQTDELIWEQIVKYKRKLLASDESELDSSSSDGYEKVATIPVKRRKIQKDQQNGNRMKKWLKNQQLLESHLTDKKPKGSTDQNLVEMFEINQKEAKTMNIRILAPAKLNLDEPQQPSEPHYVPSNQPTSNNETALTLSKPSETPHPSTSPNKLFRIMTDAELNENRIPVEQLKTHPLFQNYSPGSPSNKLYIKNIAKEVTEEDLKALYSKYLDEFSAEKGNIQTVDIRLMTTGRMKGQAFITFSGPYLEGDATCDSTKYRMIEKARSETNGLILKTKVLVVMFAKSK